MHRTYVAGFSVVALSGSCVSPAQRGGFTASYANLDERSIPAMVGALKSVIGHSLC